MSNQWNKVLWDICKLRCKLAGLGYKRAYLKMLHGNFPGHLAFPVLWGEGSLTVKTVLSFVGLPHSTHCNRKKKMHFLISC